jgi:hypothetical protein
LVVAGLLWGAFSSHAIAAQSEPPATSAQPPSAQSLEAWRKSMVATPRPTTGCFTASYPDTQWREVPCTTPPDRPYLPKSGVPSQTVGDGTDYSAEVTGSISAAEGSFDSVTGVTSESGEGVPNEYSLQLNTQFFTTTTCSGAANPTKCLGWEQFVFANSPPRAGFAFIQYWLIHYATTCPSGWITSGKDCYINSRSAPVPAQTIATLGQLTVTGAAASGGAEDSIVLSTGTTIYSAVGNDYFPDLGQNWQAAEFNVVGDGNGSQAVFNTGSTIVVRTSVNSGTASAPSCVVDGFTAETNNLTLVSTPTNVSGGALPAIVFTESNAGTPTPASCTPVSNNAGNLTLVAAVLPTSRSVKVAATATAFATIINAGPDNATGCTIAPTVSIPASFLYQTTDPTTNALTGTANTPADIAAGQAQSFVIALTPTTAFPPTNIAFTFTCANAPSPAASTVGIDTLELSASATAVPDIVALAASGDPGYVDIPGAAGTGDFAVATVNLGATGTITASANTGTANLPVTLTLCETDPASGACLASPAATVTTSIAANATPTFGIFVTGSGTVADSPGVNRIFAIFTDAKGVLRGETSVAVRTQ